MVYEEFIVSSSTYDGYTMQLFESTWDDAINGSGEGVQDSTNVIRLGVDTSKGYTNQRGHLYFDTRELDLTDKIIEDVELTLTIAGWDESNQIVVLDGQNFSVPLADSAYASGGILLGSSNTIITGGEVTFSLAKSLSNAVNDGGFTSYTLKDHKYDYSESTPEIARSIFRISSAESSHKPFLKITYTEAGLSDCNNPGEIALNSTNYNNELYVQCDENGNEIRQYNTCS